MQKFSKLRGGGAKWRWLLAPILRASVPHCGCVGRVDTDMVLCYDGRGWSALVGLWEDAYCMDGAVVDAILTWLLELWHVLLDKCNNLDSVAHIDVLPSVWRVRQFAQHYRGINIDRVVNDKGLMPLRQKATGYERGAEVEIGDGESVGSGREEFFRGTYRPTITFSRLDR